MNPDPLRLFDFKVGRPVRAFVVKLLETVVIRKGGCGEGYSYAIASPGDQCVVCEWVTTHPGLRRSCQSVGGMASLNSLS